MVRCDAMALKMPRNSLFAILLRSRWWVSAAVGAVLALVAAALLPDGYRLVGALSTAPFFIIAALAARRQAGLPSAAEVEQWRQDLAGMAWPAFADLLEQAFRRDGHEVRRADGQAGWDFELQRGGRTMLVAARRWKSARAGLEPLRALQSARVSAGADDALVISLAELTDAARAFAVAEGIAVWQADELARAFRGMHTPVSG